MMAARSSSVNSARLRSPGQQAQRPAPALDGWSGAGQRNQLGLLLAIELALIKPLADPVRAESGLQALQDEALPQALHGRDANIQRRNDPLVRPCWAALGLVGLEQDLRMLELADIGLPRASSCSSSSRSAAVRVTRYFFIARLLPVANGPTGQQAIRSPLTLH